MARVRRDNDQRYLLREELAELDSTDLPSLSTEDPRIQDGQISNWDYTAGVVNSNSAVWDAAAVAVANSEANWDAAFSWGDHAAAGYLVATTTDKANWDTAFGWGDHAAAGYLTSYTETDPTVPSHVKSITTTEKSNWNTAYGWGNHASAGYWKKGADIPGSANLNNYTTPGFYHQNANSNAASGSNYPTALAGMLEVTQDGVMVYQRYTAYNTGQIYTRSYYNGTWYPWYAVWDSRSFSSGSISNWNAAYADTSAATNSNTGNTLVKRNASGDSSHRYLYTTNVNMSSGNASLTPTKFCMSNDNWLRWVDATNARAGLNVPTRTGGNASGTWGINVTGSSASCTGNAATASWADQCDVNATDTGSGNYSLVWHSGDTLYRSSQMYYNRDAQRLTVPNITATLTGSSTSCTGNAATATRATDSNRVNVNATASNQNFRMVFTEASDATDTTGTIYKDSSASFYYNPSSNFLRVGGLGQFNSLYGTWSNNGAANASSKIIKLTQAQYDAIGSKDANALYIIVG